jgi:predicted aconitase with swiveling domain
MADRVLPGHPIVEGVAKGPLLAADEPLSFWGGYDAGTGRIIDRTHALTGQRAAGAILAIPETRGSSTTTAVLLESVRQGNAPAGIVTRGTDAFLALASIVAEELYGKGFPVVSLDDEGFAEILGAAGAEILPGGEIRLD